jgi:hypothetical protein
LGETENKLEQHGIAHYDRTHGVIDHGCRYVSCGRQTYLRQKHTARSGRRRTLLRDTTGKHGMDIRHGIRTCGRLKQIGESAR